MKWSVVLVTLLGLAFVVVAFRTMAGGDPTAGEPVERANPSAQSDAEYWTPERLREAKPLEMPSATPPREWDPSSAPPDDGVSVSEPGRPGDGDVVPDESNVLFPGEADDQR